MKTVKLKNSEIQIIRHALYEYGNSLPGEQHREGIADVVQKLNEAMVIDEAGAFPEIHRGKLMFKKFEEVTKPLIKFINDNYDPHTHAIIDSTHAELSSGICAFQTMEFVKD